MPQRQSLAAYDEVLELMYLAFLEGSIGNPWRLMLATLVAKDSLDHHEAAYTHWSQGRHHGSIW